MADAVANAGSDPTVIAQSALPTSQVLSGSGTAGSGGSTITAYSWSIVDGPAGHGASLTGATTATPTLTNIDTWGNYRILLVVTDDASTPNVSVSRTAPDIQSDGTVLPAAPESAFVTVRVKSTGREIQKPAQGERDHKALLHAHVAAIEQNKLDFDNRTVNGISDVAAPETTGPNLDYLCDGSYATQSGSAGGTDLHLHDGPAVDAATTSVRGTATAAEAPVDPATPKFVTQDRHRYAGFVNSTMVGGSHVLGTIATPTTSGNQSTGNWHAYAEEAGSIEEFAVSMSDAGTTAGGGYTFTLYIMTEAQFVADNFGGATTVGTAVIGAPSADNEPGYARSTGLATAYSDRSVLVVKATTAPGTAPAQGSGLSITIFCRKKF